jgi:hypothetical protein
MFDLMSNVDRFCIVTLGIVCVGSPNLVGSFFNTLVHAIADRNALFVLLKPIELTCVLPLPMLYSRSF